MLSRAMWSDVPMSNWDFSDDMVSAGFLDDFVEAGWVREYLQSGNSNRKKK